MNKLLNNLIFKNLKKPVLKKKVVIFLLVKENMKMKIFKIYKKIYLMKKLKKFLIKKHKKKILFNRISLMMNKNKK